MSCMESTAEQQIGQGWEGSACPILVRGTTAAYRRALANVARSDDLAVEIGSAAGITTVKLARICKRTIGVDAQESEVAKSVQYAEKEGFRTTLPDDELISAGENTADTAEGTLSRPDTSSNKPVVQFVVAKVKTGKDCKASLEPLEKVLAEKRHVLRDVSLLAVDIAGTASLDQICPVVNSLRELLRPRITVVKSLSLRKLAIALAAGDALLAGR